MGVALPWRDLPLFVEYVGDGCPVLRALSSFKGDEVAGMTCCRRRCEELRRRGRCGGGIAAGMPGLDGSGEGVWRVSSREEWYCALSVSRVRGCFDRLVLLLLKEDNETESDSRGEAGGVYLFESWSAYVWTARGSIGGMAASGCRASANPPWLVFADRAVIVLERGELPWS
jgi:hypothetical protein